MEPQPKPNIEDFNPDCPKCGENYLYIEDWGIAGALFVHGLDTDAPSGLRHKVACQVPEPVALNAMTMDEWRKTKR